MSCKQNDEFYEHQKEIEEEKKGLDLDDFEDDGTPFSIMAKIDNFLFNLPKNK